MDLTFLALAAAAIAVLVGAAIEASIGFGMNLVVVPVLALVLPDSLPVVVVLLTIPVSTAMLRHEHSDLDTNGLTWLLGGRIPGSLVGAWIAVSVSVAYLKLAVGSMVLLFVAAALLMPPIPVRRSTQTVAGAVSGVTGTAAGIGGPPLALLYQHHAGGPMRSTLAACYFVGTFLSFAALAAVGAVAVMQILLALILTPFVLGGAYVGRRSHSWLEQGWLRPAVLVFSVVSATAVIVDALV